MTFSGTTRAAAASLTIRLAVHDEPVNISSALVQVKVETGATHRVEGV